MGELRRGGRPSEGEKTRIELRLDSELAKEAEQVADRRGFSSLQQWLTVLVTREVRGERFLDRPISVLGLSTRLQNALTDRNLNTVADVVQFTAKEILVAKNVGQGTLDELRAALAKHGLALRGETTP